MLIRQKILTLLNLYGKSNKACLKYLAREDTVCEETGQRLLKINSLTSALLLSHDISSVI